MDKQQLQEIFKSPYSAQSWQDILIELFGATEIRRTSSIITSDSDEKVEGLELGRLKTTDHYEVGLFAFEIKSGANLKLNRVGLRSLVKSYTRYNVDAALVVYFDDSHWRLSFICDLRGQQTSPKRFTYVFGNSDESYRTASGTLSKLSGSKPTFDNIKAAFSVEALSKDFFKGYKEQYAKFCKHIGGDHKWQRDYVKKMMGRLVFLQFLQKKGWMGVDAQSQEWIGGDLQYTQNLVKRYEGNDRLLTEVLEPLFFDTLNTKRDNDIANPILGNNVKIPYLNGGLFDRDKLDEQQIDFPYHYFADLLDFFSQYNFTIDENDPNDAEVGIDPEMLGHIFENLLEDNKDKGAFYTPKEIVQYMCRQSLIEYLQSKLGKHTEIERFINSHDTGDCTAKNNFIAEKARDIERLLDDVKVCDPAIGSGAFPMGILNEIFHAKMALDLTLDRATVKKNIIQNSIYGVDIEQGAVDIARLRFWLSLVVDESTPSPLPNLDYKIMQGNSLVEQFEGIDLSILSDWDSGKVAKKPERDLFGNLLTNQLEISFESDGELKALRSNIKHYFSINNHDEKNCIRKNIESAVVAIIENCIMRYKDGKKSVINNMVGSLNAKQIKSKEKVEIEIAEANNKLSKLRTIEQSNERPYFLWHLYFKDVFDRGGFDIVIGNPPYIQMQLNGGALSEQLKDAGYTTFARAGDIYCLFYEKGIQILRDGGVECFITSNKWMRAGYGDKLRRYLAQHNPLLLIDLGAGIFESATVDTNILLVQRAENRAEQKAVTLSDVKHLKSTVNLNFAPLPVDATGALWIITSIGEQTIKDKIRKYGTPLKKWAIDIYFGVKTGYNEAFIIDTAKRDELVAADPKSAEIIKPILRGRGIDRYASRTEGLWIIFIPWHFPLHKDETMQGSSLKAEDKFKNEYPIIYAHLLLHKDGLSSRNKAETGIRYEWYAMQRCAATYYEELAKEKIVWKRIGSILRFCYDDTGSIVLDSTCFASGENSKFLVAVLNSKMGNYLLQDAPKTGTGDLLISVQALEPICIPKLDTASQRPFIGLVDKIIDAKRANPTADTTALETQIDTMVYALYNLTEEEIKLIEHR